MYLGLATYGTVVRSIVQTLLNNDAELIQSVDIRFTGHVFPGESLKIKIWKEGSRLIYEAWVVERGTKTAMGAIGLREEAKF
jgi:acyl dehydratase